MTDVVNNPSDVENLLKSYESGVAAPAAPNADTWLEARSAIERQRESLSADQQKRLAAADKKLTENADLVKIPETANSHPRSEWWWYADVLAESPAPAVPASNGGGIAGRIFTGIEVAVLLAAVVLLLRNAGVAPFNTLFQPGATPTSTPAPSLTPLPTATTDVNSFDMAKATPYNGPSNVVQITVPIGWQLPTADAIAQNAYVFSYGNPQEPSAVIQVILFEAAEFYSQADPTGKSKTAKDALVAYKQASEAQQPAGTSSAKYGDVVAAKVGNLEGAAFLPISRPGNLDQGTQPSEAGLYAAELDGGKRVVIVQSSYNRGTDPRLKETIDKMLASLVVDVTKIPTATPTATLHPLLVTATALGGESQQTATAIGGQIIALTPSPTPSNTPTTTNTPDPRTPTSVATITASGLKIEDLVVGTGDVSATGKTVTVKYRGTLLDGTEFDSSYKRQPDTIDVALGTGSVIKGWDEGLVGMKVGGKRRLTIPPELGYGAAGSGAIPPNSTLLFEVELVAVK